jgi:polysaccharide biosynthesis/export protein
MIIRIAVVALVTGLVTGCAYFRAPPPQDVEAAHPREYVIAPGDSLQIFVWRNPDLSVTAPVRPDGRISVPLLQDVQASGTTAAALGASIASALSNYIQDPQVTVILQNSAALSLWNIRVVGEAVQPKVVPYQVGLTLMDVMAQVGGLTEFADGNRASLIREVNGRRKKYHLRIADLVKDGDMRVNAELLPGDVISIPERWY